MNTEYDVIVIGAGPAGENVADLAARGGLRVAIVERELVGGECSYWACMPSKALLRPGEALDAARRVPGAAQAVTGELDVDSALARRDALSAHWDDSGQVQWLKGADVDLIRGHGRLAGVRLVEIEGADGSVARYEAARAVVVSTGTAALIPPIPGMADIRTWDSRDATTAKHVPDRLLILGGGVVGVEMAQAWKSLGASEVTVVEMQRHLLPREEPFAGEHLASQFQRMGIDVHVRSTLTAVERAGDDGPVTASVVEGGSESTLIADEILVAVGRRPLTSDLGLETVGLVPGQFIEVDDRLRATDVDGNWLYAVGDANGRALLTHTGKYQARIAGAHIAGSDETAAWGDRRAIPRVVFTNPAVAAVGMTTADAEAADLDVRTVEYDLRHLAATAALGKGYRGPSRLVIDGDREVVVGATFVGPGAAELLHSATIAIVGQVPLGTLWHAVPAFPTVSEVWLRFLEAYRDTYERSFV